MIERQQFVRLHRPNDDSSGLRDSTEAFFSARRKSGEPGALTLLIQPGGVIIGKRKSDPSETRSG